MDGYSMKLKTLITTGLQIFIIISAIAFLLQCSSNQKGIVILENRNFRYEISKEGKNLSFIDKKSGTDYLRKDSVSWCAKLTANGRDYNISRVTYRRRSLILEFAEAGTMVDIKVVKTRNHIDLKVESIEGEADALTFVNIPLTLEGMPYEPFAACALSMNLFTRVRELPALQSNLWATCYRKFGLKGAEVTIIGVPQKQILPVIRDVIQFARDIPYSNKGGAWALMQKEGYGSYLMNFGTLTEETVDEWIGMCQSLGFNQIDNHGGGDFFRFGDFELNREKWPEGWETYKKINDRLHKAGISSIFHTYAFFIDKNSRYVTPVPSQDLGYFSSFTLARPLKPGENEIVVNESTANISTITGFFVRNSLTLRIGGELIEFRGVTKAPPYKFTGCKRGTEKTKVSLHSSGDKVYHLREMFGRFVPGPETELFSEIAAHTAEIINECGFDGVYFDAIDGSDILAGEDYFWYYGTKFIFEVAKQLKHPVGMEMSSMAHHWWHYRSRWQAWDRPVRGYKRFEDIHSAAIKSGRLFLPKTIKSNENEHGLWRGNTPLINKYAAIENGGLLLPLHLGWWGNQTWNPPQVEQTFTDDIEYLCSRMIGNNAGLSMLGGVDKKTLDENPGFRRLIPIIKRYEELRHADYFNDSIRALLRQPGREFKLIHGHDSTWRFRPVSYEKHKVTDPGHTSAQWKIFNKFESQPAMLRLEALMSVKPFDDPSGVILADFSGHNGFEYERRATGVTGGMEISSEKFTNTGKPVIFHARAEGIAPQEGSYIKTVKKFNPSLDLNKNQALGVWVNGDGKGELLNLRIESPKHISSGARGDHFVKIDFTGWRYFELVEIESSEFSNYIWPDSGFYVYDSYRHTVHFNNVDKLQLWYQNLPAGTDVQCLIGTIKALQMVPITIIDPEITIGGEKMIFKVKMESGMYLEFNSLSDCRLYGTKGEFIRDVKIEGKIPLVKEGENDISFRCEGTKGLSSRVQLTLITEDKQIN
jgi:hypothetical protein